MKQFVRKFLLVSILFLIFIFFFSLGIRIALKDNQYYKIDKPVSILILGNSHAANGLNDSLIPKSLNLAQSGECYFYTFFKLQKLIKANSNIRFVVMEYTNNIFFTAMDQWIYDDNHILYHCPKYCHLIPYNELLFLLKNNPSKLEISFKQNLLNGVIYCFYHPKLIYKEWEWGGYLRDKNAQTPYIGINYRSDSIKQKIITYSKLNI